MFQLNKSIRAIELAEKLNLAYEGGSDLLITNLSSVDSAGKNSITFSKSDDNVQDDVVVIASSSNQSANKIVSEKPRFDFIRILEWLGINIGFVKSKELPKLHNTVTLGKNVVLENNVIIGEGTIIEHNVTIMSGSRIGANCLIRANSVIGSDGFGYERMPDGTPVKFIHLGGVKIGNNVEVGACTCIAKGTLDSTIIEDNVKIDNLVHIAHNCVIKKGAFIIASSVLCGGVEIGEGVWVAPNATITQKANIGKGALVGLGAVVTKDVQIKNVVAGNPAKVLRKL